LNYSGEIAAISTAFLRAFTAILFTYAGKRIGAKSVTLLTFISAIILIVISHLIMFGTFFPFGMEAANAICLGISGVIGIAVADAMLFKALLLVGPRITMLLMTLTPVFCTILAWFFRGQVIQGSKLVAILVTLTGLVLAIGKSGISPDQPRSNVRLTSDGVLLGVGAAFGDATGMLFSDLGMKGVPHPVSGSLVRILGGTIAFTLWLLLRREFLDNLQRTKDIRASVQIFAGAITGPLLGVFLALHAITHTSMGVASTLMSLTPIFVIPVSSLLMGEQISLASVAWTGLSILGAAFLFFL